MSNPVDTDNLDMLKEVIGEDLKEILSSFIDIVPNTLSDIEKAMQEGDAGNLQLHAHTLKGSSANIGAIELPNLALVLENAGKDGQTENLEAAFSAVKSETQAVLEFLQNYNQNF